MRVPVAELPAAGAWEDFTTGREYRPVDRTMHVGFRTLVRGFLLVGGLLFLFQGVTGGSVFDLVLGLVATLVGGVGVWLELREQAGSDEPRDNL